MVIDIWHRITLEIFEYNLICILFYQNHRICCHLVLGEKLWMRVLPLKFFA